MPILDLQRRLREIGRIRIGEQRTSEKSGKRYPAKLSTFRFTSQDRQAVDAAAGRFGGAPTKWDDAPAGDQWQLTSQVSSLSVIVPPGGMAFSQWFETWSGGGCLKRCDGQWDNVNDRACSCDPAERECKPHTRLSVILADLPGLGVWRLDTSGFYAATELGGVVEVCEQAAARGQFFAARLMLEEREVKRVVAGKSETRKFGVPVLDVDLNLAQLVSGRAVPALAADTATGEIGSGPQFTPVPVAELPAGWNPTVAEQAAAVVQPTPRTARKNAQTPIPRTTARPRTAAEASAPVPDHPLPSLVQAVEKVKARIEALNSEQQQTYGTERKSVHLPTVSDPALWSAELVQIANGLIDEIAGSATPPPGDVQGDLLGDAS